MANEINNADLSTLIALQKKNNIAAYIRTALVLVFTIAMVVVACVAVGAINNVNTAIGDVTALVQQIDMDQINDTVKTANDTVAAVDMATINDTIATLQATVEKLDMDTVNADLAAVEDIAAEVNKFDFESLNGAIANVQELSSMIVDFDVNDYVSEDDVTAATSALNDAVAGLMQSISDIAASFGYEVIFE